MHAVQESATSPIPIMVYPSIIVGVAGFLNHVPCWCARPLEGSLCSGDLFSLQ